MITEKVKDFLNEKSKLLATQFYSFVFSEFDENPEQAIESPVEQLFYIEWRFRQYTSPDLTLELRPQYQNNEKTGKYRLDFHIDFIQQAYLLGTGIEWDDIIMSIEYPLLGIEIDSHIWHEKTKEQVQYHKERERFLISKGWKLIRFTGSEVYRSPEKCIDETLEMAFPLSRQYHKILREKWKQKCQKV